ncbi:MAG: hypothetical protein FWE71_07395 [Nocardioidaceae bacterium]|nr:hypothetical protein [Nocardioidaceae bacterium]MCL2612439.1 hypothetical protein [Nocardioidaceae bacterium]
MSDTRTRLHSTGRGRLASAIAAILLVVAVAVVAAGQWWLHQQRSHDTDEADVRSAADDAVTSVLSYDYRRLQAGMRATTPLLTGDARSQYLDLQKPLLHTAPKLQAVVDAQVKTMSVLDLSGDSARVLLFVDQTSSSKWLSRPQLDQSRILVTMTRSSGHWLVSTLAAI